MSKKPVPKNKPKQPEVKRKQTSKNILPNEQSWLKYALLGGILILTYITFLPALINQITNWDDNVYLMDNLMMQKPISIAAQYFFTHFYGSNYFPFPQITYSIIWNSYKFNPVIYHEVSLIFHILNVALVFWFIYLLSGKKIEVAVVVAVLFGIHPMRVESVAWIAELKDVQYSFFFIFGLICYYKYIKGVPKNILFIILAFIFFILSGFSKPAATTFSLAIILIDFYTKRKFDKWVVIEKIPFLLLSLGLGILTIKAQQGTAIAKFEVFTIFQRFMFASYSMLNYIYKLFLPINLSALYPYPHLIGTRLPYQFYAMPVIALLILGLVFWSYKYTRIIAFGFLFFLANIVLVLQFMSVGIALISERYTYIPYIGLFFIIGMGFSWIYRNKDQKFASYKSVSIAAFIGVTITLAYLSSERCKVWFNCDILWSDVIKQFPDDAEAYKNRGGYLVEINKYDINPKPNDFDRAFNDFNTSIAIKANDPKVYSNRGNIFALRGKYDLSLADYSKSIELDSSDFNVYLNRGITYSIMEKYDSAFADWDKVLKIHGPEIKLYQNRAYAYVRANRFKETIEDYKTLEDMGVPMDANMYFFRSFANYRLGNYDAAIADNTKAIAMNPNYKEAYYNRGQTYNSMKKFKNAYDDIIKAQSLGYKVDPSFIASLKKQL